jgi:3-dehydroquinate synthase
MSTFQVELKKVVDDSYDIEIGFELMDKLIEDLKAGLVGNIHKFAIVTDSTVKELYGDTLLKKVREAGYGASCFISRQERKVKPEA